MDSRARFRFRLVAFLLPLVWAGDGWAGLDLESCRPSGAGKALCGTLSVPENRDAPGGRTIDLNVVVLPASDGEPAPDPIVFLHGGPGAAATAAAPMFARSDLRKRRDVLLVDQRGTGKSNPFECDDESDLQSILHGLAFEGFDATECRESLNGDPRFYTTSVAVDDLEAVRRAYGAEQVNLIGGSYGTRVALDYMRRHPGSVRTAFLRGVAPPPYSLPSAFDHDSLRALNLVLDDCAADRGCNAAFPRLRAELDETVARLDGEPGKARVRDPFEGGTVTVPVSRDLFVASLHYALYLTHTATRVPAMIHRAHRGDFDDLIGSGIDLSIALAPQMSTGAFLSVACAEDLAFLDPDEIVSGARGTLLRGRFAVNLARACAQWNVPAVPDAFKKPVRSDAPVLMVSGNADPVTPPRWAEQAMEHLPNARHVVLPEAGHGELTPGCVADLVERLFETGSTADLDVACAARVRRPRFVLDEE